jgi:hypothetical protein
VPFFLIASLPYCLSASVPSSPFPLLPARYNAAMVMRWLIRGVCLVLLAGVVSVGAASYAGWLGIDKWSAGRVWEIGAVQGLGYISGTDYGGYPTTPLQFRFQRDWTAAYMGLPPRTLGFFEGRRPWVLTGWLIIFPLWLPALLLVVLNGFVWRWMRQPKLGVGAAGFPVEPAKKADA